MSKGIMRFMMFSELPFDPELYPAMSIEDATAYEEERLHDILADEGFVHAANVFSIATTLHEEDADPALLSDAEREAIDTADGDALQQEAADATEDEIETLTEADDLTESSAGDSEDLMSSTEPDEDYGGVPVPDPGDDNDPPTDPDGFTTHGGDPAGRW